MRSTRIPPILPFAGLAALAAVADQMTKLWALNTLEPGVPVAITPFLSLTLGFNTGVSFGMFAGSGETGRIILMLFTGAVIALLTVMAIRWFIAERLGLSLMVGGALGNLFDRVMRGRVTDFIDLHARDWHWPAFNLADAAITLGIVWIFAMNLKTTPAVRTGD